MTKSATLADPLRSDGYRLFRGVVSPDQIAILRQELSRYLRRVGRSQYGGLLQLRGMNVVPAVAEVLSSEPILDVVKACAAPAGPVMTGECDLVMNTTSGWHKDLTPDMSLDDAIADRDFAVYKAAIYLQDQDGTSPAALKVRPGSHRKVFGADLPVQPLAVKAGDMIVFDVRLDHAGHLPSIADRVLRRIIGRLAARAEPERLFTRVRAMLGAVQPRHVDRMAVFMTFGPDAPSIHLYERSGRHRHGAPPAALSSEILDRFASRGVTLMQLSAPSAL